MNISMKLVYQYMTIFFTFSPTSNHLHPLQVENCDSNLRHVVDEDDIVKSGLKGLIEYLCNGSAVIIIFQLFQCGDHLEMTEKVKCVNANIYIFETGRN